MKYNILFWVCAVIAFSPIIALMGVSWLGCDLGNEGTGGLIELPLYCVISIPVSAGIGIIALGIMCFFDWKK